MKISIIAAVAVNNVIGVGNKLPWNIPDDLKRFRKITLGHHILMGQNTFESIGKLLPGRENLILSLDKNFKVPGAYVFHTPEAAISFARGKDEKELMVIGGAMVYKTFFPLASKIYLTRILKSFKGDAFFPNIDKSGWKERIIESHKDNDPPYEFVDLERI